MFGEMPQFVNFKRLQFAMAAGCEAAQLQRSEGNAFQGQNLVTDACQQASNFAILPFLKFHLQNDALAFTAIDVHASEFEETFSEVHAFAQLPQCVRLRNPGHVTSVSANDFKTRMSQPLSQIAVVCQQQHSFGVFVEAADGKQTLFAGRHQVDGSRAALRIMIGAKHALRLVDEKITQTWHSQAFGVEPNILSFRINGPCRIRHDFRIHGHSTRSNVLFAVTPRIHSGHCQKLLQTQSVRQFFCFGIHIRSRHDSAAACFRHLI
jgi:hypothetical protein